jgi:hypothetical protein
MRQPSGCEAPASKEPFSKNPPAFAPTDVGVAASVEKPAISQRAHLSSRGRVIVRESNVCFRASSPPAPSSECDGNCRSLQKGSIQSGRGQPLSVLFWMTGTFSRTPHHPRPGVPEPPFQALPQLNFIADTGRHLRRAKADDVTLLRDVRKSQGHPAFACEQNPRLVQLLTVCCAW